jgi:hypothetical protein
LIFFLASLFWGSEGRDSLSSIPFDLELDSTVAELPEAKPDTSLAPGLAALGPEPDFQGPDRLGPGGSARWMIAINMVLGYTCFMKATIEFEDELYRRLKATAALRGMKVRELVNDAVRKSLQQPWSPVADQADYELPLIGTPRKKPLSIPDDIAARLDSGSDRDSHAASLR